MKVQLGYNLEDLEKAQAEIYQLLLSLVYGEEIDPRDVAPRLITMFAFSTFVLGRALGPEMTRELLKTYWDNVPQKDNASSVVLEWDSGSEPEH